MMRLIVNHYDIFHAHQVRHDPLDHLALGLLGLQGRAAAFEQRDRGGDARRIAEGADEGGFYSAKAATAAYYAAAILPRAEALAAAATGGARAVPGAATAAFQPG